MSQTRSGSSKFETQKEYLRQTLFPVNSSSSSRSTTSTVLCRVSLAPAAEKRAQEESDIKMPNPVIENILDYTPPDEKARLVTLFTPIFGKITNPMVDNILDYAPRTASSHTSGEKGLVKTLYNQVEQKRLHDFKEVSIAILSGVEPKEVMELIEQHPEVLLVTADEKQCRRISGLSGHCAAPSLYRTALAARDTQMAEKIKAKLVEIAGIEEANAQYDAQFPKGWEQAEEKRWQPIFEQMERIIQAIRQSAPGDITSSGDPEYKANVRGESEIAGELAYFRLLLDETLGEAVMTGRHFNDRLLQQAFQNYANYFDHDLGGDWIHPRALLYWQQVIGIDGIQSYLPVNYMQAFCGGLSMTAYNLGAERPQGRLLRFNKYDPVSGNSVPTDVYPVHGTQGISGFCICGRVAGLGVGEAYGRVGPGPISQLMSNKNSHFADLRRTSTLNATASRGFN